MTFREDLCEIFHHTSASTSWGRKSNSDATLGSFRKALRVAAGRWPEDTQDVVDLPGAKTT